MVGAPEMMAVVDELLIALVAAVFGLAGTVVGAVVAARAAKAGADKNAETARRQVEDQATAEHAHWLRQQRLTAYEGFLEAWDECLRLTRASADPHESDPPGVEPLRAAAGHMAERARRIALLGPPAVTQAAEELAETMQQDVDATAEFLREAEAGTLVLDGRPGDIDGVHAATKAFTNKADQLRELLAGAQESGESVDGHPLLAEYLEAGNRYQTVSQETLGDLQANLDQLASLADQATAVVDLLRRNQAAREASREQFTAEVRAALGTPPLSGNG
ncbi:hypothetical protein [Streptomyces sp. col6]|uniref:hypothetical protein n=1 Tax=Streptomyces sp. col6 TaxID=2478958 RepID=UPI0011CE288A|nr:hypothetical protein [Streptomyces sp. col6]